ncbi:sodium- and chloride-dependent glycine transporter 1-like [Rhipicephalus sanguineus]|uniref:sodium- and chloride-dependent glycine transporter 1-like n=1 Tax=Rhipicephalus sanguineus TaxID=34632 RepID=UPI0020C56173|nr:sodium- and chloride-dependent glycine transporter 1-like [Rhipicephalus sanguineus]
MQVERQPFRSESDCLLCCLNFCIGLSNVATFPYLVYDNGGLVFLAVYLLLLCTLSAPMLYLEMFLGQFCGWSVPKAFDGFPMARGLGWTMLFGNLLLALFHIQVVAYCWVYMTASLSPVLPWSACGERDTETLSCYEKKHSAHLCSMVNETLAREYLSKNYTGDRVIVIHAGRIRLPVNVPIAEYEAMRNSCIDGNVSAARSFYETAIKIAAVDMLFGLFAGFFVFALYGHLADAFDEDIADIVTSGMDYLFVTFPETIDTLPNRRLWALAFYVLVSTSALGPELCTFGAFVGSLADLHPALSKSPMTWAFVTCTVAMVASLPLSLRGIGIEIREFIETFIYGDLLPWIGFSEVVVVMFAYGKRAVSFMVQ